MLQRILALDEAERARHDASCLRAVLAAGAALPGDLALAFMDAYGEVVYNLYGSTEAGWGAIAGPADLRAAPGTVGRPPRGTTVRVLDAGGRPVGPGETGRIYLRNRLLFERYSGGGTKEVVDGHMSTGDMGHLDEAGRLFVAGRDDDMIVSGGENVFPQEVQELLAAHEAVAEVAVVGVRDEQFGQRLAAFVVPAPGPAASADDLRAHVKARLARYKVPRDVEFVEELPRTATGKVAKAQLRERAT
jgi:fatty-acyl-CoA synthase